MQVSGTDVNGNGTIDYEEFLAATIHQSKLEKVSRQPGRGGLGHM